MATTGELPDPSEDNRNKEKRLSHERTLPQIEEPLNRISSPVLAESNLQAAAHRIELRMTNSLMEQLKALAQEEEISVSDVIQRALMLYALAQARSKEGMKLGLIAFSDDGKPEIKGIINP